MILEKLLVEQRVLRCVECVRTIVIEVPAGSTRDPHWLRRLADEGDLDLGPFSYLPVADTEYLEPLRTRVIGVTDEPADVPHREAR